MTVFKAKSNQAGKKVSGTSSRRGAGRLGLNFSSFTALSHLTPR
jgi:hypothetical protein